ncbi:hybrid sensor histidine kinase/response regulator [Variovorax sp. CAN2819]|uniref:ATP-binding response regulator n=1 Tax=Variovorax sp. CAN15 TaxID=3046727 RepID=UPI0026496D06|nr:hybrid sensor histidine kinase/response regulator [Variovorax sp. CAN15]MDN6882138.1 hybrid sensor histidine kinase/response regulator [Variovorax sp. CAN15]
MKRNDPAPGHLPLDATLEMRVLREHVASLYAGHTTAIVAHMGFAIGIGCFGYFFVDPAFRLLIVALIAAIVLVDLYALRASRWTPEAALDESPRWARKYTRIVTAVSTVTAPSSLFLVSIQDSMLTTFVTVVIMGSWTRAVQARWPLRPAMFGYGIPMMSGLIISLAWYGGALNWFLAGFAFVNLVLTLSEGVKQNKRLTATLILQFENEALAAQLREQIAATERASAEKTHFLAAASHDLRQPMHAIALFGAALGNTLRHRPEVRNVERLMRAVNALGASLDTMLDISRLDAGVVQPVPHALALDELLLPLHNTFSVQAERKRLQLRVRASGLWVRSDPQLLYRMLSNLVDNALKYTRQGGVTVVARRRGGQVWIEVRDTGIGIAPEQAERIFEEFYQVNNPGRDRSRGLGIGLSIVRRLGRLLDHQVELRSRPGRGTCFRLTVPLAEPSEASQESLPLQELESPVRHFFQVPELGGRVLLIDDEEDIREAMTELMRAYGIDVVAVADEAEAVEMLMQPDADVNPIALLMCDYRLGEGADGLQVGLRLRERFRLDAPLLLVTGETAPERLQRVRECGVPVLFKPVSAATLMQAIVELVHVDARVEGA